MIKTGPNAVARRRTKAYSFGPKHSQRNKLSAQQRLSLARRRLLYAQTITRFQIRFQSPLWPLEKENLAQHLHLEIDPQIDVRVRDELRPDAARKDEGGFTGPRMEVAEVKRQAIGN